MALVPPDVVRRLTRLSLEAMAFAGAVMLVAACIVITPETPFPGIAAAAAGGRHRDAAPVRRRRRRTGQRTVSSEVLAVAPMRIIGDWSYSLYLWHWPALILPPVALDRALTPFEKCLAVLVVITLSAYSYRFVEMPFRTGRPAHRLPRRRALVLYPASAVLVVATAGGAWLWTGSQGGEHGDNPPITVAGAPIDGACTTTPRRWCGRRSPPRKDKRAVPSNLTPDLLNLRDSIADVGDCDYEENVRKLCRAAGRRRPHPRADRRLARPGLDPGVQTGSSRPATGRPTTSSSRSAPPRTSRSPRSSPTSRSPTAPTSRTG